MKTATTSGIKRGHYALALLSFSLVTAALTYAYAAQLERVYPNAVEIGLRGQQDFIAYWSAYQVARNGGNPYSHDQILQQQRKLFPKKENPTMFLNPPWFLTTLGPIANLDFGIAYRLWFGINLTAIAFSVLLSSTIIGGTPRLPAFPLIAASLNIPLFYLLMLGQATGVICLSLSLSLFLLSRERYAAAALCLLPLSAKPHLFIGVFLFVAAFFHRRKRLTSLLLPLFCFAALAASPVLLSPSIYSDWLSSAFSPLSYETLNPLSLLIHTFHYPLPQLSPPILTGLFSLALAYALFRSPALSEMIATSRSGLVVAGSLICAPYFRFYDLVLLLIPQSIILSQLHGADKTQPALWSLTLLNAISYLLTLHNPIFIVQFWYPYALILLLLFFSKNAQPKPTP